MTSETSDPAAAGLDLPRPLNGAGEPRKVGIEIEFGGLTEQEAARIVAETLGGTAERTAAHDWVVRGTEVGDIGVELDTSFRKKDNMFVALGVEITKGLVPVEVVTAPVAVGDIATLDRLCEALRDAGASGSRQGVFLGFGVHFNPEIPGQEVDDLLPVLRAYAFLEDWLRLRYPIDTTRRLMPFVDRYPPSLLDALAVTDTADWSLQRMARTYLEHVTSRNHGLDLLPLLSHLVPDAVGAALGPDAADGGRPTWHFRLPDCRIDEPDWQLADGWEMWQMVEHVAGRPELLDRLAAAWRDRRGRILPAHPGWAETVSNILEDAAAAP